MDIIVIFYKPFTCLLDIMIDSMKVINDLYDNDS